MRQIKAIIFDLDGTLVNSTPSHVIAWLEACKIMGLTGIKKSQVEKLMGKTSYDIARELLHIAKGPISLTQELAKVKDELFFNKYANRVKVIDRANNVLMELKRMKFKICVVSSNPKKLILKVLESTGLIEYVDSVVGQDEVNEGKPSPEPILIALKRLSVKPNQALVVGDSEYDIIASNRANVRSIGVNKDPYKKIKLINSGALTVVNELSEVVKVIKKLSAKRTLSNTSH